MQIISWNVNGIRAFIRNGAMEWVRRQGSDVICFQEVRARPEQVGDSLLFGEPGYKATWFPAERSGYSGVATFCVKPPIATTSGLGIEAFDREGRLIRTQFKEFTLFNIYFPNGGRDQSRVGYKLDFYATLLKLCDECHARGEKLVLCGDFNTAHQPSDLKNPQQNANTSGFLAEERAWVSRYLEHGLVDCYRLMYPRREQYTWWTYRYNARKRNIGWRLDYFLVSEELMHSVTEVTIHDEVLGSDHCPLSLSLDL